MARQFLENPVVYSRPRSSRQADAASCLETRRVSEGDFQLPLQLARVPVFKQGLQASPSGMPVKKALIIGPFFGESKFLEIQPRESDLRRRKSTQVAS